jgi:hypothetical protein
MEELLSQESWPHDISPIKSRFRHLPISRQGIFVTIRSRLAATSETLLFLAYSLGKECNMAFGINEQTEKTLLRHWQAFRGPVISRRLWLRMRCSSLQTAY